MLFEFEQARDRDERLRGSCCRQSLRITAIDSDTWVLDKMPRGEPGSHGLVFRIKPVARHMKGVPPPAPRRIYQRSRGSERV